MSRTSRPAGAKPRRDEILEQATRLFAEAGYEGTSMGDLAERVGMRKASLFYHFASKDVLYAAVLDRLVTAVSAAIAGAVGTEGSFAERLDSVSDAMIMVLGQQPFAARILLREAMDRGPVLGEQLSESIAALLAAAERFLQAGQRAGVFVESDVKQILVSLIGIYFMPFGIADVVSRFTESDPFEPRFIDARRDAVREQVRGLLVAKSAPLRVRTRSARGGPPRR